MIKINIFFLYSLSWFIMMIIIFMIIMNYLNPIILNILLIIYSMLICLNLSLWKSNYLYSIILFLIMISGMLIIFLYFSSIISNEQLKFFINLPYSLILIIIMIILLISLSKNYLKFSYLKSFNEISPFMFINLNLFNNITYMYNFPFNYKSILCMLYLMLTLIIIIKICSMNFKPLRKIK